MDLPANKILGKNFSYLFKVMPTHYLKRIQFKKWFLEYRERSEITIKTQNRDAAFKNSRNTKSSTGDRPANLHYKTLSWCLKSWWAGGGRQEGLNIVGEGDQGKQETAHKQNCLKLRSSTLCVLANKHFGNSFFFLISWTLFGGVPRRVMPFQTAMKWYSLKEVHPYCPPP